MDFGSQNRRFWDQKSVQEDIQERNKSKIAECHESAFRTIVASIRGGRGGPKSMKNGQKSSKNRSKKQAETRCHFEWILKGSWSGSGWILRPTWTPKPSRNRRKINEKWLSKLIEILHAF